MGFYTVIEHVGRTEWIALVWGGHWYVEDEGYVRNGRMSGIHTEHFANSSYLKAEVVLAGGGMSLLR
jgi:hypothetical protein